MDNNDWEYRKTKVTVGIFVILIFIILSLFPTETEGGTIDLTTPIEEPEIPNLIVPAIFVHGLDWLQTRKIQESNKWEEKNRFLGKEPEVLEIDLYFIGTAASMYVLSEYIIPKKYRGTFTTGLLFNGLTYVLGNRQKGIRILNKHF